MMARADLFRGQAERLDVQERISETVEDLMWDEIECEVRGPEYYKDFRDPLDSVSAELGSRINHWLK